MREKIFLKCPHDLVLIFLLVTNLMEKKLMDMIEVVDVW